jgi:hypothetical protein
MRSFTSDILRLIARREFLRSSGLGIGAIALMGLLDRESLAQDGRDLPDRPHFDPKAKRLIYLHMVGGPSQIDLFDPKPLLAQYDNQPAPPELLEGQRFAFLSGDIRIMASAYQFGQYGQCGAPVSQLLPQTAGHVDELTFIKSMHTDEFNHGPAQLLQMTGFPRQGRPCLGSWLSYGLGSENENLPAFIVLVNGQAPGAGRSMWDSGFLPSEFDGVEFRTHGEPVLFVREPRGTPPRARFLTNHAISQLNRLQLQELGDPRIAARIESYELAYRMQTSAPELTSLSSEPKHILEMYGIRDEEPSFARNCLLARRLIEQGTRVVQLYDEQWDHHKDIRVVLPQKCGQIDQAISALLQDLKQRSLLDDTLVVWGGEFGRTPMLQGVQAGAQPGRDHQRSAFTMWLAGAGVKPGFTLGRTDELGGRVVDDPVHVHDLNATILHLMGLDHKRLTYRHQGRDMRLTDVAGNVVEKILA